MLRGSKRIYEGTVRKRELMVDIVDVVVLDFGAPNRGKGIFEAAAKEEAT